VGRGGAEEREREKRERRSRVAEVGKTSPLAAAAASIERKSPNPKLQTTHDDQPLDP